MELLILAALFSASLAAAAPADPPGIAPDTSHAGYLESDPYGAAVEPGDSAGAERPPADSGAAIEPAVDSGAAIEPAADSGAAIEPAADAGAERPPADSEGMPARPTDSAGGPDQAVGAEKDGSRRDTADALELQEKSSQAAGSRLHRQKEVSRIRLTRSDLQKVAAAQGDPLKVLGTLPGVVNQNDLSVRPFVRGGKAEETQILWDGVALLQPYHFGTLYSIFNTESLRDMTLYAGGFPVESGNALSAAILMRSRPPPVDSLKVFADLSMLRGSAYAGIPLVKNRLAVSVSWQAFWYDWVIDRGWDLADLMKSDSSFSAQKQEFRTLVQLPNFRDLQLGLAWKINEKADADYLGLLSADGFRSRSSKQRYYYQGREVSPDWYSRHAVEPDPGKEWTSRQGLDTVANVAVDNQIHALPLAWRPTQNLEVTQALAYQRQAWHVQFADEIVWHDTVDARGRYAGYKTFGPSVQRLKLAKEAYDWNLDAKWHISQAHLAKFGAAQSTRAFRYDTYLPRPLYETIVDGSVDITEGMSILYPDGLVIRENDSGLYRHADFITSIPNLLRFDYAGHSRGSLLGAYAADEWSPDARHRLTVGLRAEGDTWSGSAFLSPRLAWFQALGQRDELTLASGLYSQADFPFNQRDANPGLKPEKSFHFNAEWTHHFSHHYRMEVQAYQKNYYDLAVPLLRSSGRIDWQSDLAWGVDSAYFESLSPEVKQALINRIGLKEISYASGGIGKAGGCELSFFYDPNPVWSGWISAEAAYSKRQDFADQHIYAYRYSRPWAFNWVNYFHMPSNYLLSLRARYAAGLPYSEYRSPYLPGDEAMGDTVFYLSPRNQARYAAYSRWDLRLAKEFSLGRRPMQFYTEVWNMFNSPNFIMRDGGTGRWKFFDANYPIPILFIGMNWRW